MSGLELANSRASKASDLLSADLGAAPESNGRRSSVFHAHVHAHSGELAGFGNGHVEHAVAVAPAFRKVAHQALTTLPGQFPGSSKKPESQGPARPRAMTASGRYLPARGRELIFGFGQLEKLSFGSWRV